MKMGWLFRGVLRKENDGEPEGGGPGEKGDKGPVKLKIGDRDIDPAIAESALNLYEALSDPETGKEIIESLARKTGLLDKKGEIEKKPGETDKAAERRVQKALKKALGKDFEVFSDKVGPVLDDILEEMFAEHKTSLEESSGSTGWEAEVERFEESHTLSKDVEKEMERLIRRNGGVPKGLKGKSAQEYITDMYELASHKLGKSTNDDDIETPKRRSRRAIDEVPEFREVARPKSTPSIDQIVEDAMAGRRYK